MITERVILTLDALGEARLLAFLTRLDGLLAGVQGDRANIARQFGTRLGNALLEKIHADFLLKAAGGADSSGMVWQKLHPSTIARRRVSRKDLRQAKVSEALYYGGERGLLTPAQNQTWKRIFTRQRAIFINRHRLSDVEASRRAAQIAWAALKREGAQTKLAAFGNRTVQILMDTGELLKHFNPSPNPDGIVNGEVLKVDPGLVTIQVEDARKKWHHQGTRRGLPKRPFWPERGNFPSSYWQRVWDSALSGLVRALALFLNTGGY